jgi:D-arabinose 1-dehydrogenase-like Zn-dependent alcohol dehydrogenase
MAARLCELGRILGHEDVGVVEKDGAAVTAFTPGVIWNIP